MSKDITIYVLSDSVGETGEQLTRAALSQFNSGNYTIKTFPFIISKDQIIDVFNLAKNKPSVLVYTLVIDDLKDFIIDMGLELDVPTVDLLTPALEAMEEVLGFKPKGESGLIRKLDENYFKKVEAVEFAVKYDDGKDPRGIKKADIVLTGISRTSKTPLSMYLAHKKYKVANVPLVPEVQAPAELFEKERNRIIGLVADPYKLNEIRQERLKALGLSFSANYANVSRINEELEYSREIMKKLGCLVIDVSNKAIEETAGIIINHMRKNVDNNYLE